MTGERALEGLRVLLVEDQYLVAAETRRVVAALGGTLLGPHATVAAAIAALDAGPEPDLAVLDVNLGGDRVYPFAHRVRERGLPMIFLTGYDLWAIDPEFRDVPLVSKPVNAAVLTAALAKLGLKDRTP